MFSILRSNATSISKCTFADQDSFLPSAMLEGLGLDEDALPAQNDRSKWALLRETLTVSQLLRSACVFKLL